jgi:hypothetical protein
MSKIISFLKTNYFIRGLIFLVVGFIVSWIRVGLLLKANIIVGYGSLKLIADILWVISLIFLTFSVIKEKLVFKITSAICIFFGLIFLIYDIIVEIKYGVSRYQDVTQEYNQCIANYRELQKQIIAPDYSLVEKYNSLMVEYNQEIPKLNRGVETKEISFSDAYNKLALLSRKLLEANEFLLQYDSQLRKYNDGIEKIDYAHIECLNKIFKGKSILVKD